MALRFSGRLMVTIATPSSRAYSISSLTRFPFPIRQRDMPSIERSLAYPNTAGASRAQSRRLARGLIELHASLRRRDRDLSRMTTTSALTTKCLPHLTQLHLGDNPAIVL